MVVSLSLDQRVRISCELGGRVLVLGFSELWGEPKDVAFVGCEFAGYLVIPDYASAAECATLLKRLQELLRDFDPSTISIFSTTKQVRANLRSIPTS